MKLLHFQNIAFYSFLYILFYFKLSLVYLYVYILFYIYPPDFPSFDYLPSSSNAPGALPTLLLLPSGGPNGDLVTRHSAEVNCDCEPWVCEIVRMPSSKNS